MVVVMMVIEGILVMVIKAILMLMKVLSTSHSALSEPGSPLSTVHINLLRPPIPFMRFKNNFHASEPKRDGNLGGLYELTQKPIAAPVRLRQEAG